MLTYVCNCLLLSQDHGTFHLPKYSCYEYHMFTYLHTAVSWKVTADIQSGLVSFKYAILEEKPHKGVIITWINDQLIANLSLDTSLDFINM